ncbi:MAG: cytochrome [Actinomycetota bacterium]
MPPVGSARLPWDEPVDDPVGAIAADRAALGDTFAVESGDMTYLFVFSPDGVRAFYDIAEDVASKGIADMRMLSRKVPVDLFFDRRTIPHDMFTRSLAEAYVANVDAARVHEIGVLGDEAEVDVFDLTRRLGHRFGLASWGGPGASASPLFERLVPALDRLDASAAFVTPEAMAVIAENDHAVEREALADIADAYRTVVAAHDDDPTPGMFATIAGRWEGAEGRVAGIAHDVALVHLGSMSNLFAALGWAIVHLAQRPESAARVAGGDRSFAQRCALESTRLAQRSIMLREVLQPTKVEVDGVEYALEVGATLATLLPLTNTTAAEGLEAFDPDRWSGRRLGDHPDLAARELVTGFGHGSHTCPAQPFSLRVMVDTVVELFATFEVAIGADDPTPRRGQIGGVARSDSPCPIRLRRR